MARMKTGDILLLSGNEAIARGAWESDISVCTGYPGTPSTEILETITAEYRDIYTEWSVNEKVAFEVGIGASLAGARTLVTMKHVGLNVAADPLFTASYIGIKGGLVLVAADDPAMHSSQNEQDSRHYAVAAKLPMLEPSDSQEAKDFVKEAVLLSEKYDTPVILRTTTRISHSKTVVEAGDRSSSPIAKGFVKNIQKYVMIPAFARKRHAEVEKRMTQMGKASNTFSLNRIELKDASLGFITSGICYAYVREAFPNASVLKLGMVYPMPDDLIKDYCSKIRNVYIVEELDPHIESHIKSMGINVQGKNVFPNVGEFDPDIIKRAVTKEPPAKNVSIPINIPNRPPSLCPGCPHRKVFSILHKLGVYVTGDIGCYTLGVLPPFSAMDTCVDMGASITIAQGIEVAEGKNHKQNVVAVIGDSTFAHSGITGLLNAAYNQRNILVIILDNGTTAMTGMQPNPLSGETIRRNPTVSLDYSKLAQAIGIPDENFRMTDAYNDKEIEDAVAGLLAKKGLSLVVVKGLCVILQKRKKKSDHV
jgi:indolepyruvate ferredoxin oxidoreductase alpha subunit